MTLAQRAVACAGWRWMPGMFGQQGLAPAREGELGFRVMDGMDGKEVGERPEHLVATIDQQKENFEADCALIAAAPQMLEVLEEVEWSGTYNRCCLFCLRDRDYGHLDDCKLQAAIKKARGE